MQPSDYCLGATPVYRSQYDNTMSALARVANVNYLPMSGSDDYQPLNHYSDVTLDKSSLETVPKFSPLDV